MKLGELYWVDLPPRGGREQRGRRPALIWQDMAEFSQLPTALVIPFTANLGALRFQGTVRIEPSPTNGLTTPSVALVFQLGACDVRRFNQQMGLLDAADIDKIREVAVRLQHLS